MWNNKRSTNGPSPNKKTKNINTGKALKILPNSFKSCCIKYWITNFKEQFKQLTITMVFPEKQKFLSELCHRVSLRSILFKLPILFSQETNFAVLTFSFPEQNLHQICFITFKTEYLAPLSRKGPSEIHIEITTASVRVLYHLQCSGNQLFLSSASAVLLLVSFLLVTLFVTFVSLSLSDASAVLLLSTEIFSPIYQDLNSNTILQHIL